MLHFIIPLPFLLTVLLQIVREEGREEIQRESKQKQVSLGSLRIIGVVLAVGLPAILLGCNGESTPQATAETAPAPKSILYEAAHAIRRPMTGTEGTSGWLEAPLDPASRVPFMLEFATLGERPLEGGGIGAEILVPGEYPRDLPYSYENDVKVLGQFILWRVWPKKHFSVLVYNSKEAWEARGLCEQAHEGEPAAKSDEIEGGPICTRATQLEKEHLLMTISRNPSTFQADSLWTGPDLP